MPFVYNYQVDANGDYVLNGGNRVIEDSYEFASSGGFDWRRVASSTKKPRYVRSFQIKKFDNGDTWLLIINQKQLVGIYPSQDAALQVLLGCFTRVSASDLGALETMSYQLSQGYSFIDPAYNNLSLTRSGDDLIVTLSLINTLDPAIATPIVTWDDYSTPGSPDATTSLGAVTEPEGGTQVFTIVGGWTSSTENYYIQAFLEDSGVGVVVSSNVLLKDEVDPSGTLSVDITNLAQDGPPEATWDGQTYAGAAYATPQWTVEDWPQGVTPSYQYAWAYQLDNGPLVPVGGSGATLNLALVPYGATIKCGAVATAYVNGKIVNSQSPAPMVAVAVTDTNIVDVVDIKLFTAPGANPADDVTSNPPADTQLYAYAYSAGDQLITGDVTFFEGSGVVASFTGTPSPSAFDPSDGTVVSITDDGVAGTDTPTLTYLWSTGATTATLDTTGLDGTAITCTVTASNQWEPSATAVVDFGTVQPSSNDWDTEPLTYAYGASGGAVTYVNTPTAWNGTGASGNNIVVETFGTSAGNFRIANTVSGGWNADTVLSSFPHAYVWDVANGWQSVTQTTTGNNRPNIDFTSGTVSYSGTPIRVLAFYAADQGDISGWRAYDGPIV